VNGLARAVVLALTSVALPARAVTLEQLLLAADTRNVDRRIAVEQRNRVAAEYGQAWSGLLPSFTGQGVWTRNQYPAEIPLAPGADPIVITPQDQFDAFLRVEMPLIDAGRWFRAAAAGSLEEAALLRDDLVRDNVRRLVATTFYGYGAALAFRQAAERSLAVAEAQERDQEVRSQAGASTQLDLLRARAEVQRNRQTLADAEQLVANNRRALASLTGLTVDDNAALPPDDLAMVGTLEELEGRLEGLPAVRVADKEAQAADRLATAAGLVLVPVVTANFTERLTNATGFIGEADSYTAGVGLTWPLNVPLFYGMSAQSSAASIAALIAERQRLEARDQIHRDWQRLRAAIEKVKAAAAQVVSARSASETATARYTVGAATQIDVIQAERDFFSAEVNHLQARSELASSQVSLRISAGLPLRLD
jgi:outer membrane protein TolC